MNPELVSIITPLFNKGRYIRETLDSVVKQLLSTWELIVVENGSTDAGPQHVDELARRDPRVHLVGCAKRGPGAARNAGLKYATGSWCLFLDADDLIDPNHLSNLLEASRLQPESKVVAGGWAEFVDGESPEAAKPRGISQPAGSVRFSSIAYAPWPLSAAIVRRDAIVDDLIWDEDFDARVSEDAVFWFRILQFHLPVVCDTHGFRYRLSTNNSRNEVSDLNARLRDLHRIHENNVAFLEGHGILLSWRHAESLMRTYISVWERANQAANKQVSEEALSRANHWLRSALDRGGWQNPALLARQMCGIRAFNHLSTIRAGISKGVE